MKKTERKWYKWEKADYYTWKFRIKTILAENNVLDSAKNEIAITQTKNEKEKEKILNRKNKAKSLLVQYVKDV